MNLLAFHDSHLEVTGLYLKFSHATSRPHSFKVIIHHQSSHFTPQVLNNSSPVKETCYSFGFLPTS